MPGKKKLLLLIEVQMWMRMFVWEDSDDPDFQWYLVEAALVQPKPRERMINDLRSLAQLSLTYEIVPWCQFRGWFSKVLRVESVTLDRDEGFDFVSDVFNHQFTVDVPEPRTSMRRDGVYGRRSDGGNDHPLESYHMPTHGDEHQYLSRSSIPSSAGRQGRGRG